jgi:hypothetical protein
VLQLVFEPVLFGPKPNEDTGGAAVARDDDLLGLCQPKIPREVIWTVFSWTS